MSPLARDLAVNLIADAIFLGATLLVRHWGPTLSRRDPRLRPAALSILALLWFIANVVYFSLGTPTFLFFLGVTSLILGCLVGSELYRFWRVGIFGGPILPSRTASTIEPRSRYATAPSIFLVSERLS